MRTLHKMFGKSMLASICIVGALIMALLPAAVVGAGSYESGFHISQWTGETWEEIHQHQFQVQYSTEAFAVDVVDGEVALRMVQVGTPFADIDQISLMVDGEKLIPEYAKYTGSGDSILDDILELDHNVVIAHEQEIEISWDIPAGNDSATVYLTANEYDHGPPMLFPKTGYATYEMGSNIGSITVDGLIAETDGTVPLYAPYWQSTSGHPDGYTYIYVCDDEEYVYFSLDVTGDNTNEYGEDWAEISILQPDGPKKAFRIDDYDNTWGTSGFGLTSKVNYKHQTYEFAIPKSIIGNEDIEFSLAYYGTFAGDYIIDADLHLDIQIDGDSSEGQVFQVGNTINITGLVSSQAWIKLYGETGTGQGYVYEELSVDGPSGSDFDYIEVLDEGTGNDYIGGSILYTANWTSLSYDLTDVGLHIITLYSYARVTGQTETSGDVNEEDSAEITLDFLVGPLLSIDDVIVDEDAGNATFTVSLSSDPGDTVTVDYSTSDGTATAGSDYTADADTLTFESGGSLTQTIDVAIIDDALTEINETFYVALTNATGEAVIIDDTGMGIIVNDDPPLSKLFMVNGADPEEWTELYYDDGEAVSGLTHTSPLGVWLVKFTPPAGESVKITDLRFWVWNYDIQASGDDDVKVVVFDKDGNQVYLSGIYDSGDGESSWIDDAWNSLDLYSESIPVMSDDFYIGIQNQQAYAMSVGFDDSDDSGRNYWAYPAVTEPYDYPYPFNTWAQDFMIRVGVETTGGNEIVELDPDTGAVLNIIPTLIDTDGGGDGLAYGDGRMFFTTIDTNIIYEIDPSTGDIINQLGPEPKVAVYAADSAPYTADVQAKLTSTGLFSQVDAFLVESGDPVPTLAELQEYDAVLVYSNNEFGNSTAMGDVLADYVDAGGGAVIATFAFWDPAGWDGGIGGRISSEGYLPFTQGEQSAGTNLTLVADEPEHPILSGVTSFNGGLTSWFNTVNLTSEADLVAHWSNDVPLIAVQYPMAEGAGRVVGLNFFPVSSDAQSPLWDSSTDGDLLMANSLLFAAFNYEDEIDALGFSGDALYALEYGDNATIRVLDPDTGANITTLEPGIPLVGGGTFAGTRDSLFFSGDYEETELIYEINADTGAVINSFSPPGEGEEGGLYGLGFSSSRNTLFVGYFGSNMVYEVDPDDGTVINSFLGPEGAAISALAADECGGAPTAPEADFHASNTTVCANVTVDFFDDSAGTYDSWYWDFGDGTNSTAQNPSHAYTIGGNYTVSLTISDGYGDDTETKVNYIEVLPLPEADFHASNTTVCANVTVDFFDDSTGTHDSWYWEFGDGSNSTLESPSHAYASAGNYTVSLTISSGCGSDTETKADYIEVLPLPQADFHASDTTVCADAEIDFFDDSTGTYDSWFWDFGDGSNSTLESPSHAYASAGNYSVSLTISNGCGSDTEIKVNYIEVLPLPEADFHASDTSPSINVEIDFFDDSTGTYDSWFWDFGDGTNSTESNPSHNYTSIGNYTVSLTISNGCGSDTETKVDYIEVAPVSGTNTATVEAEASGSPLAVPVDWLWDSNSSTDTTPFDVEDIPDATELSLTAPATHTQNYTFYVFDHWSVGATDYDPGDVDITFEVNEYLTAIAHYTAVISVDKTLDRCDNGLIGQPGYVVYDPNALPLKTHIYFGMIITVEGLADGIEDTRVEDGIGADLSPVYTSGTGAQTPETMGKGKKGATKCVWILGSMDAGDTDTLFITAYTGTNPKGKQQYASPGEHTLNSGPKVFFTCDGQDYMLQGPSITVNVVK